MFQSPPPMVQIAVSLADLIAQDRLFKVTAADFNGKTFDGAPIEPMSKTSQGLDWLSPANISIEARGCTDYAWFGVLDEYGNTAWAGPGDYLMRRTPTSDHVVVIPGEFMSFFCWRPSMTTERNFDHLDANGEHHPIRLPELFLLIDKESAARALMLFASIGCYHAEVTCGYSSRISPALEPEQDVKYSYSAMLEPVGQKLFELHTGITNVGQMRLRQGGVETVKEDTTFKLFFQREWKEVTTAGRRRYNQHISFDLV